MAHLGSIGTIIDPTPLQVIGGRIAGTVLDSEGNPAVRSIVVIDRSTKTVDVVTASRADGTYEATFSPTSGASERIVICLDDDSGSLENDLILRTFSV